MSGAHAADDAARVGEGGIKGIDESKAKGKGTSGGQPPLLHIEGIEKTYAKGSAAEHKALCGLDLDVERGEFVCVIGSNGAGKSTLLGAIAGEFTCERGKIVLDGENISWKKEHKRAHDISRVFQDPMRGTAPHLTVAENIALAYSRSKRKPLAFATGRKRKAYIAEQISKLGLDVGLEDKLNTQVGQLSGGQRQAIALLMATIARPKLLLLDEHTAALDPATAQQVLALTDKVVREQNLATLMVTHSIANALACGDRTIMLDCGKIILDIRGGERKNMTPTDLMAQYRTKVGSDLDNDELVFSKA